MAKQTNTAYRNQLLYSIFVRDYGKNGTFRDVEEDLPRIKALGTDIIWLMPIHPIGEIGRKGSVGSPYAIRDYRAVNPDFGTLEDFIRLTEAIHKEGMKCIIDVVYNHTSPDSVLAKEHPEWFLLDKNGKPAPRVADWYDIVDLDYSHAGLWDYQIETLKYWAQYVDGFRCDVAPLVPLDFWMRARQEAEEVRPGAFWLAESVDGGFVRFMRRNGDACLSDSEIFQAFDAAYDYDIYNDWKNYLTKEGTLATYLEALNRQEVIYPQNYVKLHFLENHDRSRAAMLTADRRQLRHQTAFSFFQKGMAFLYNGQERCALTHPTLFETEAIDWTGEDLSSLIRRMMETKRDAIFAEGAFFVREIRDGVVQATYETAEEILYGYFCVGADACTIQTPIPDGTYENEYSGANFTMFEGILPIAEDPIILRIKK